MNRLERCKKLIEICNSSPYYKYIGMEVTHMREGYARVRMLAEEKHLHPGNIVHGGAITSVMDSAGALATLSSLDVEDDPTTVEIKVNFLSPLKAGETLIAEGRVVQRGRTLVLAEMEARTEDGRLVGKALTTCAVLKGRATGTKNGK